MANKRKSKRHSLNPIIILGFVVIGLLLVIVAIAITKNGDLSDMLHAGANPLVCIPGAETALKYGYNISETIKVPRSEYNFTTMKEAAYVNIKNKFCHELVRSNPLNCTDKHCKNASDGFADCVAALGKSALTNTPVTYEDNGNTAVITFTAPSISAKLSRKCVPIQQSPQESPIFYPVCTPSGPSSEDPLTACKPAALSVGKADSKGIGEATNIWLYEHSYKKNNFQMIAEAKDKAMEKAMAGLEGVCGRLDGEQLATQCQGMQKGCADGCERDGKNVYQPPAKDLSNCSTPQEVKNETTRDGDIITFIKYNVICSAECTFKQSCKKITPTEVPQPPAQQPGSPTETDTPVAACTKLSGLVSQNCSPPAQGTIQGFSTQSSTKSIKGTIYPYRAPYKTEIDAATQEAIAQAKILAQNYMYDRCKEKWADRGNYVEPNPMSVACQYNNGCQAGCAPSGPAAFVPYTITGCDDPTIAQEIVGIYADITATITCKADCKYEQDCAPTQTKPPVAPTTSSTPSSTPFR